MPVCCKAQLEMESEDKIHLAGFPNCSRMMEQKTGLPPVSSALGRGHVSFKPSSPLSVTPVSVQFDGSVEVGLLFLCVGTAAGRVSENRWKTCSFLESSCPVGFGS